MCDNAPLHVVSDKTPPVRVVSDKTPPVANNVDVITPTLDSFYLDTIHDTEDSTFWMTDVKVNNISVTFKVDIRRCRDNGSLRKYQTLGQLKVSMPDKKLCGLNGVPLDLRGSLTVTLSQKQHNCDRMYL